MLPEVRGQKNKQTQTNKTKKATTYQSNDWHLRLSGSFCRSVVSVYVETDAFVDVSRYLQCACVGKRQGAVGVCKGQLVVCNRECVVRVRKRQGV
jgi:hypothetical protein